MLLVQESQFLGVGCGHLTCVAAPAAAAHGIAVVSQLSCSMRVLCLQDLVGVQGPYTGHNKEINQRSKACSGCIAHVDGQLLCPWARDYLRLLSQAISSGGRWGGGCCSLMGGVEGGSRCSSITHLLVAACAYCLWASFCSFLQAPAALTP